MRYRACPVCGGCQALFLGALGNRKHYRCRSFGTDWSKVAKPKRKPAPKPAPAGESK